MKVTNSEINEVELRRYRERTTVWRDLWELNLSKRVELLSNLSPPTDFKSLINQLDSLSKQVTYEFYKLISTSKLSQPACDQLFERVCRDLLQDETLILQLFEPVELGLKTHPCLIKISKIYQDFSSSKLHNIAVLKSLDWKKNEVVAQELIIYLWARRSSWHAYASNYAKDITPDYSPISEYSKLSHRMMIRNENYKFGSEINKKAPCIALLNLDLLKLLHPFMWRYDTTQMNFLNDNIDFKQFLRSIVFSNYENILLGKQQSALLEKRYEQYLHNSRLAYVSSAEKDAIDQKILNDLNDIVTQIKKDFDIQEIIFTNLSFPWEKKSLRAFQTLGKGKLRDLTGPAIKSLHLKNKMKPELTQHIVNTLEQEKILLR